MGAVEGLQIDGVGNADDVRFVVFHSVRMCQSCGNQTDERTIHRLIYMLLDKGDVQLDQYTGLCKNFQTQRCIYRWAVMNLVQLFFSKF